MSSLEGVESYLLYTSLPLGLSLWAFFTRGDGFRLLLMMFPLPTPLLLCLA